MRHFFLAIVLIAVLAAFGTCFLLAAQVVFTGLKVQSLRVATVTPSCYVKGTALTCTTQVRF